MVHNYKIDEIVNYYWDIITHEYDIINNVTEEHFNDESDYESDTHTDYDEDDLLYMK